MFIRILFWFIVFYSLFKVIIRVVLPLLITSKNVRSKVNDMRQKRSEFEANNRTTSNFNAEESKKRDKPYVNDDYIDFEEIK